MSSSDEALGQLMSMGIDLNTAQDALKKSNNDLQIALEYIYGDKSTDNNSTTLNTANTTTFDSSNNSNINVSHYEDVYMPDSYQSSSSFSNQQLPPSYSDVHEHNSNSNSEPTSGNHSVNHHSQGNVDFTKTEVKPVDSFVSFENDKENNGDIGNVKTNRNVEINGSSGGDYNQSAIIQLDDDLREKLGHFTNVPNIPNIPIPNDNNGYDNLGYDQYNDQSTNTLEYQDEDNNYQRDIINSNRRNDERNSMSDNSYSDSYDNSSIQSDYNVFDDLIRVKRKDGIPPVLIPAKQGLYESLLAPLIMILHEVPEFRNKILSYEFKDYGFNKYWWKNENCLTVTNFVLEFQRLICFLDGLSMRSFTSIKNLTDSIYKLDKNDNYLQDCDSTDEFLNSTIILLLKKLNELNPVLKNEFEPILKNEIDSSGSLSDIYAFPIESDVFSNNIYKTLHTLLFSPDFSNIGINKINKISDILIINYISNGEIINNGGLNLYEFIYPQIYTPKYEIFLKNKKNRLTEIDIEINKKYLELSKLKSFQGKKIDNLLNSTLNYLNGEVNDDTEINDENKSKAKDEIKSIKDHLISLNDKYINEINELNLEKSKIDMYDIEFIKESNEEKYYLSGVIINELESYILKKNRENTEETGGEEDGEYKDGEFNWWQYNVELNRNNSDFSFTRVKFNDIKLRISEYTNKLFDDGLILVYVKESKLNSIEPKPINENLMNFINLDSNCVFETLNNLNTLNKQEDESNKLAATNNDDNNHDSDYEMLSPSPRLEQTDLSDIQDQDQIENDKNEVDETEGVIKLKDSPVLKNTEIKINNNNNNDIEERIIL
ncbi:hypothetical protein B5S31_g3001 [[Candida] boidinii]|nr:hypothetical protein B5S31_g3001 [[Candida] boidinii]